MEIGERLEVNSQAEWRAMRMLRAGKMAAAGMALLPEEVIWAWEREGSTTDLTTDAREEHGHGLV